MYNCRPFKPVDFIQFKADYNPTGIMKIPYLNHDDPSDAYKGYTQLAFVAQPLKQVSDGVVHVPLMMTDEWDIIRENVDEMIKWRGREKYFLFNFVGQTGYMGREVFKELIKTYRAEDYLFKETETIYNLDPESKKQELLAFLDTLSFCRFTFAPRGIGSSSFRAYQAMMVGSVPIITGMNHYPFDDEVDWDSFSLRGELSDIRELAEKAANMSELDWTIMSENAKNFWDEYCRHDSLYNKLEKIAHGKLSQESTSV